MPNVNKNSKSYKDKNPHARRSTKKFDKRKRDDIKYNGDDAKLEAQGRDNDPNWYFLDKSVAEQVSQLSFQQLAGVPIKYIPKYGQSVVKFYNPSIFRIALNPAPGVQMDPSMDQKSGINLAGFRLFSKLSAYTGRVAIYGPQDISTMILFMGEIISLMEYLRRAFGVAFTYNERNRAYPKTVIEAMGIDADDLFKNFSDYRTRFNSLVTRVNQVPIPGSVAYFDKCAALYEKLYLDSESPMAQTILTVPWTTWELNEAMSPSGTVLKTSEWIANPDGTLGTDTHTIAYYLVMLSYRIDELMNSSTFQVVYTDLLNLATKMQMKFWKFDYLIEGYTVMPEYNVNFLLQLHNSLAVGTPIIPEGKEDLSQGFTPLNDVFPDPNHNALLYNPGFGYLANNTIAGFSCALVDSISPTPTVEDRIEMTRFMSLIPGYHQYIDADNNKYEVGYVLPDHYIVEYAMYSPDKAVVEMTSNIINNDNAYAFVIMSAVDWAPLFYCADRSSGVLGGQILGDINFTTDIEDRYLRKVNDFIGLALYDFRN